MLIDEYFDQLENVIHSSGSIYSSAITRDKRSEFTGYFRADLYFLDGSSLHVREFVFTSSEIARDTYAYHYQPPAGQLVFRYDNTRHFPELDNFPHHKHTPNSVVSSQGPDLQYTLEEATRFTTNTQ